MIKSNLRSGIAVVALFAATPAFAQSAPPSQGMAGSPGMFEGYVPAPGMSAGTVNVATAGGDGAAAQSGNAPVPAAIDADGKPLPALNDGRQVNADKIEGFNEAVEQNFPMTPEMIRTYRQIYDANERALHERVEPKARSDASFITLEPGEAPPTITLAPGIATVVGFYDVTGQPWPIEKYILGAGSQFQAMDLGDNANNLAITPLTKIGFTNMVVALRGEPKPAVIRINISEDVANYRRDIQVLAAGPNATANTAADHTITEAGSKLLLQILAGVDIPSNAKVVNVIGVDARGWAIGDSIFLRSKNPLLSPRWTSSMSGPDGVRVYEIKRSAAALFSVDGQIVRADLKSN